MSDHTDDETQRRELIAQLFGAFGRTPNEGNYAGYLAALKLMPTPRLARVVAEWLERIAEATDPEELRVPTAGKLWDLHRKLKRLPNPQVLTLTPSEPAEELDAWAINANTFLANYITQGLVQKAIHDQKPTRNASRYSPDSRYDSVNRKLVVGQQTIDRTAILVKWKNAWARDMREDRELYDGTRDGKAYWAECMASAEREIDQLIAAERAAA